MGIRGLIFGCILFLSTLSMFLNYTFNLFNLFGLVFGTFALLFSVYASVVPIVEYNNDGFEFFKSIFKLFNKSAKYSWDKVGVVSSYHFTNITWVITKDGRPWFISSLGKNNYFDTLRDLAKYIPESKFDELTLKRVKIHKTFYLL